MTRVNSIDSGAVERVHAENCIDCGHTNYCMQIMYYLKAICLGRAGICERLSDFLVIATPIRSTCVNRAGMALLLVAFTDMRSCEHGFPWR